MRVGFFLKANEGIYNVLRRNMPAELELVTLSQGSIDELLPELDFLVAGKVTAEMFALARRLRFVQAPGAGTDGIDLEAAAMRGIPVATTVCGIADEVAELTFALILAVERRLVELDGELRRGNWLMWDRRLVSRTLAGRTLGIVGMGRIGREVAARAASFKVSVRYSDPEHIDGWSRQPLDQLLAESDIVSLHVPLSPFTRRLINRERIALMKPGAVLINVARGEVVDEGALIEALLDGRLAGAGLDVFDPEPPSATNPLLNMRNVVITPHVGSGTLDSIELRARAYFRNIQRFLAGEDLEGLVQTSMGEPA